MAPHTRSFLLLLSLQIMVCVATGCTRKDSPPPSELRQKVTICTGGNIQLLPLMAEAKGFFIESGIEGVVVNLGDGRKAIDSFLSGDCTFGLLADPPVVTAATKRNDFVIVASTSSSDSSVRITARRDRGIKTPADLKGKRLGIKKGLNSEAFAMALLARYGISPREVEIVPLDLKEMPQALADGKIDAFSSSPAMLLEAKRLLGNDTVILTEPGLYFNSNHLLARKEFLSSGTEIVRKTLRALLRAEELFRTNPEEGYRILAARAKITETEAEELLRGETIAVRLSPAQIRSLTLNAEILRKNGTISAPFPDPLSLMEPAPLGSVQPAAVTIGR